MSSFELNITDKAFVENLIPQEAPFVMVDKLLHFEENKVVAGLSLTSENIFVNNNTFAATGLIEHMAQTVALYTGYQFYLKKEQAPVGYIGAIKMAEVYELPEVADDLTTTVNVLHDIMGVTLVEAETTCNGKIIARSEMKTILTKQ